MRNGNGRSQGRRGRVQVLHFCLMQDHLHAVLYVRQRMEKGIRTLVRGLWQGTKKLGRAPEAAPFVAPNNIRKNLQEEKLHENLHEETARLEKISAMLCKEIGNEAYYSLEPVFTEMPFIRPMGRRSQLPNTIRYIDMNPQRLVTKRQKPGYFRVQRDIGIGERKYDGVGNVALQMTVMGPDCNWIEIQIRSERMDYEAEHGCAAHWLYKEETATH